MGGLDFSALDRLAYRGCSTAEEQAQKDALIERGFAFVEEKDNPFLQASDAASGSKGEALESASGARDYRMFYRAAFDYHKRNTPPPVDRAYWSKHTVGEADVPEAELRYWMEAAEDASKTSARCGNDPFLSDLLSAVYAELEREYKKLREAAQGRTPDAL